VNQCNGPRPGILLGQLPPYNFDLISIVTGEALTTGASMAIVAGHESYKHDP